MASKRYYIARGILGAYSYLSFTGEWSADSSVAHTFVRAHDARIVLKLVSDADRNTRYRIVTEVR